jgi:hypothetical protein
MRCTRRRTEEAIILSADSCFRRAASAADTDLVFFLITSDAQHFSLDKDAPAIRTHCRYAHSVRAASSLCADMIFGGQAYAADDSACHFVVIKSLAAHAEPNRTFERIRH